MSRNLSIRHLRSFLEVAQSGSFTVASTRLFLTQSALTTTIQQFEEAVGTKLFDRTTRRVVMTPAALSFKGQAEKIVRDFDAAIGDLESFAQSQQGHVRIAAAPSALYLFVARAAMRFRAQYPQIKLTLRDANAQQVEQLVADGVLDFAIATKFKGIEDLDYTPLIQDSFGVICRADYPVAVDQEGTVAMSSLHPEDYVGFTSDTGIGSLTRRQKPAFKVLREPTFEVSSSTSLLSVLNEGGVFSIAPALTATISGFESLRFHPLSNSDLSRQSFLVTRKLRSLSPSSQRLLSILSRVINEQPLPPGVVSLISKDLSDGDFSQKS